MEVEAVGVGRWALGSAPSVSLLIQPIEVALGNKPAVAHRLLAACLVAALDDLGRRQLLSLCAEQKAPFERLPTLDSRLVAFHSYA